MEYLNLFFLWCLVSLISIFIMMIVSSYDMIFIVHFFIGAGLILIWGLFECIKQAVLK